MDSDNSIEVNHVCKSFTVRSVNRHGGQSKSGTKEILKNISFNVKHGEIFGIIGRNGSGKSTILKLISGIIYPDSGTIELSGRLASILELGMGFDSELSGRENAINKCRLYGMSESSIKEKIEDIIQFSELGEQIDFPMRTYSSGMSAKLAFAVCIHVDCDILLIDEVLSVSDESFNYKCKLVFNKMKSENKSVIFTSHNLAMLQTMCDTVMWIDEGEIKQIGFPQPVCYGFHLDTIESPETLLKLSNSGDTVSMNRLGLKYLEGRGVERNLVEAKNLFKKASDMGNTDAAVNLGDIYFSEGNETLAMEMYSLAAQRGNINAIIRIYGRKANNAVKATRRLKELADSGNIRAILSYAEALDSGIGMPQDRLSASKYYEKAIELGDLKSMYILGLKYRDGEGIPKDPQKALELLTNASDNGHVRSMIELARMYSRGVDVEYDVEKSIEFYKKAASMGDEKSMLEVATIYRNGIGVPINQELAEKWSTMYVAQRQLNLEYKLADILYSRSKSNAEIEESYEWFLDAAKAGSSNSQYQVGLLLHDGIGTLPDMVASAEWLIKAAQTGNYRAMITLADMYKKGIGVSQSFNKAAELYSQASMLGNSLAMYELGTMLISGLGIPKDEKKGKRLLEISADYGNKYAISTLSRLG